MGRQCRRRLGSGKPQKKISPFAGKEDPRISELIPQFLLRHSLAFICAYYNHYWSLVLNAMVVREGLGRQHVWAQDWISATIAFEGVLDFDEFHVCICDFPETGVTDPVSWNGGKEKASDIEL